MNNTKYPSQNIGLDKKNFKILFEDHYSDLCYYARRYVKDMDVIEDIVHEVFINLWEKRETIDLKKQVKSYLYRSVANRCINYIRDHKKFDSNAELSMIENQNSFTDDLETKELEKKILNTIESLPEKCRQVFKMNRFEDMKYKEIAEELNISVKTVEVQISKALKSLRDNLKDYLKVLILSLINFWNF